MALVALKTATVFYGVFQPKKMQTDYARRPAEPGKHRASDVNAAPYDGAG